MNGVTQQVCRALSFLNNDAKLKHNNLHAASVFVTPAGDWKLAGLESVCGVDQVCTIRFKMSTIVTMTTFQESPVQILPSCNKYSPPERGDPSKARTSTSWGADVWGLGCLIWEVSTLG